MYRPHTPSDHHSVLSERQHRNISSILSSTNHSRRDFQSESTNTSRPQNVVSVKYPSFIHVLIYGPIYDGTSNIQIYQNPLSV